MYAENVQKVMQEQGQEAALEEALLTITDALDHCCLGVRSSDLTDMGEEVHAMLCEVSVLIDRTMAMNAANALRRLNRSDS
jgi:hypothetical protein